MHTLAHHDGGTAQVQRRMDKFVFLLSRLAGVGMHAYARSPRWWYSAGTASHGKLWPSDAGGRSVPLLGSLQYVPVLRRELTFDLF